MLQRLIHDIVDRMLTDREFLTTFRHTPLRALRVYGLPGEDLGKALPLRQGYPLVDLALQFDTACKKSPWCYG